MRAIGWAIMASLLPSVAMAEQGTSTDGPPAATEAPAGKAPAEKSCVPACRTGYVCVEGRCVSACNPPCEKGQRCTAKGECERDIEDVDDAFFNFGPNTAEARAEASDPSHESSDDQRSSGTSWQQRGSRRSTGMMVSGIVATAIGGITELTGLMLLVIDDDEARGTGIGLAVTGGVLLAIGIPMTIVGASPKPGRVSTAGSPPVTASIVLGGQSLLLRGTW